MAPQALLAGRFCEITDLAGHPVMVMRQGEPEDRSDRDSNGRGAAARDRRSSRAARIRDSEGSDRTDRLDDQEPDGVPLTAPDAA